MHEAVTATIGSLPPAYVYRTMLLEPELSGMGLNETLNLVTSGIMYGPFWGSDEEVRKLLEILSKLSQRHLCVGDLVAEEGFHIVRRVLAVLGYLVVPYPS